MLELQPKTVHERDFKSDTSQLQTLRAYRRCLGERNESVAARHIKAHLGRKEQNKTRGVQDECEALNVPHAHYVRSTHTQTHWGALKIVAVAKERCFFKNKPRARCVLRIWHWEVRK